MTMVKARQAQAENESSGISSERFEELFIAWWRKVFAITCQQIGNRAEAEDAASEVFLRAYKGRHTFRGDLTDDAFGSWIHGIIRRTVSDVYRGLNHTSRRTLVDSLENGIDVADQDDQIHNAELRQVIEVLLDQLTPPQRRAVELRYFENLDFDETAKAMQIPSGTARGHISRGFSQLRATNDNPLLS